MIFDHYLEQVSFQLTGFDISSLRLSRCETCALSEDCLSSVLLWLGWTRLKPPIITKTIIKEGIDLIVDFGVIIRDFVIAKQLSPCHH